MIRTCLFAIAVAVMTQAFGRSGLGAEGPPAAVDRRGSGGKPPEDRIGPKASRPPRKVVIGTAVFGPYGTYPGFDERLREITGLVDDMAAEVAKRYPGRGLDLAILPETTATSNRGSAKERAIPLRGKVQESYGALARKHRSYLLIPLNLAEEGLAGPFLSNAAVLFDRKGEVVGVYRKAHPVALVNRG